MSNEYKTHVDSIIDWLEQTAKTASSTVNASVNPSARSWCTLGLPNLDPATIRTHFDTNAPNNIFQEEYDTVSANGVLTNVPVAYLQMEADAIYALQKSFSLRHSSRLQCYRNDCEQKDVRVHNALHFTTAKLQHLMNTA